ncbi:hypothetical protein [Pseudomonas donghuensis]|uniref:hypothetical protein n=1 Tax=Pseudomonas donghuensis TaxID=1163398 RepID=UPI002E1263C1|nr:hypothetical protein VP780_21350 [Pseudomonas donghuensis]
MLKVLKRVFNVLYPDRRPDWEQKREREFIQAANSFKTLRVTPEGGMFIDPEELREQIVSAREQLKHLVHKPGVPSRPFKAAADLQVEQETSPTVEAPEGALDYVEVVAWRRLPSGNAVRYVCLQCASTGRFAVATASLFPSDTESFPPWMEVNTARHVASAIQRGELRWLATVSCAIDAWDAAL